MRVQMTEGSFVCCEESGLALNSLFGCIKVKIKLPSFAQRVFFWPVFSATAYPLLVMACENSCLQKNEGSDSAGLTCTDDWEEYVSCSQAPCQ